MLKKINIFILVIFMSGFSFAESVIDKEQVLNINKEIYQALLDGDISIIEKYISPESKITIDFDPALDRGETEVSYDNYLKMAKVTMSMMKNPNVNIEYKEEIKSAFLDTKNNQVIVKSISTTISEMMGMKLEDISEDESVYGVVNEQIKLILFKNKLISSKPIK
ncbi:hypothetical protein [Pseudocolwellia agarivorans]|uniref:hypothetical protein n=1 Tax=Pseudocolwellia agarivorans TaxID=1911682 RepID=UPI0009846068|nr:hypothetical protein [Pseudocolwellia agarivorans]